MIALWVLEAQAVILFIAFKYWRLEDLARHINRTYVAKRFGEKVGKRFEWWCGSLVGWIVVIFLTTFWWENFYRCL
ncbi:hypothetical protein HZC00_04200 [Candidatus Kaiserbacteria bacterium]|nr:hypothetical protein [Candidatus Kaiserbacteria bacterium]